MFSATLFLISSGIRYITSARAPAIHAISNFAFANTFLTGNNNISTNPPLDLFIMTDPVPFNLLIQAFSSVFVGVLMSI